MRNEWQLWVLHLGLITLFIESVIAWAGCQSARPCLLLPQEPMRFAEAQLGGGKVCFTPVSINSAFNGSGNGTVTSRPQWTCHRILWQWARIHIVFSCCLFPSAFLYLYILLLYCLLNIFMFLLSFSRFWLSAVQLLYNLCSKAFLWLYDSIATILSCIYIFYYTILFKLLYSD